LVSVLKALGAKTVADDSSGNAAAALAAYAARAGLKARLFVPAYASEKKLRQVEAYGAALKRVPGVRAQATLALRAALERDPELVYASHNESPYFELGQRTIAYEIAEELGWRAPDHVVAPVGGGALFLGIVNGFSQLVELGLIGELPRVHAVQAAACAPIVAAWRAGLAEPQPVEAGDADELVEQIEDGVDGRCHPPRFCPLRHYRPLYAPLFGRQSHVDQAAQRRQSKLMIDCGMHGQVDDHILGRHLPHVFPSGDRFCPRPDGRLIDAGRPRQPPPFKGDRMKLHISSAPGRVEELYFS
jgi:hypothetical protein